MMRCCNAIAAIAVFQYCMIPCWHAGPQGLDSRNALPDAVAVVQGDGNGFCQCGPCTAIYKDEGGAISGAVVRFVNGVADSVAKSRPEYAAVRIDTLAYEETLTPPAKTAPRKNVTIRVCPIDADFHVPFTDDLNKSQATAFEVGTLVGIVLE